jgi:hypothetical protein
MIISSPIPMKIGEICTRYYEGPQTKGERTEVRVCALRTATREEYVKYGLEQFGDEFSPTANLLRGWNHYYEISID